MFIGLFQLLEEYIRKKSIMFLNLTYLSGDDFSSSKRTNRKVFFYDTELFNN